MTGVQVTEGHFFEGWSCILRKRTDRTSLNQCRGKNYIGFSGTVFSPEEMSHYIDDLLRRFQNKALQDTLYRVGRDLLRKLSPGDRLLGTFDLLVKHKLPRKYIRSVIKAALNFKKENGCGHTLEDDRCFRQTLNTLAELKTRNIIS